MVSHLQQSITQLDHIIAQEVQTYQQLLDCLDAEKRLLVARQLGAFLDNLHQKETLTSKLSRLEQIRQQLIQTLASLFHLPASDLTLGRLSTLIHPPYGSRFGDYRKQLKMLLERLQQQHQENERLLTDSSTIVNEALTFFACLGAGTPTYGSSGGFSSQPPGRLLSERV